MRHAGAVRKVSIVIRVKNEEFWIRQCLEAIFSQKFIAPEVIIVDNDSTDRTLVLARNFPIHKILTIKEYLPGKSLNIGIEASTSEYVVLISGHCIPDHDDWANELIKPFEVDNVVGVYGRQMPLNYSSPSDFRDLIITFPEDDRIQTHDPFFHNANSAIRKSAWLECPFDSNCTNIEDRLWAAEQQRRGRLIYYSSNARVFHHHGIHHSNNPRRAENTWNMLRGLQNYEKHRYFPDCLAANNRRSIAIVVAQHVDERCAEFRGIEALVELLVESSLISKVLVLAPVSLEQSAYCLNEKVISISLDLENCEDLNEILARVLETYEESIKSTFDYVVYANPEYIFRPKDIFNEILTAVCAEGKDMITCGVEDYSNYIVQHTEKQTGFDASSLNLRGKKLPHLRLLYGICTVVKAGFVRQRSMSTVKNFGIKKIESPLYPIRLNDDIGYLIVKHYTSNEKNETP
jgi:rhamnosyltransferase